MDEVQTTLNSSNIDAKLFEFARKNDKGLEFILRELEEYRRLKRTGGKKREV